MGTKTLSAGQKGIFFVSLLCANFAAMFAIAGSSIFVSAAMAEMEGLTLLGLAFTLESLFRCVVIPLSAKLGERYLRRNLFLVGLFLFTVGTILCAVAWAPIIVLVARSVMGLAWGLFFSNIVVMLSDVYPSDKMPKMNGFLQTFGFIAVFAAPVIAGLFVDFLTWQWALYVTIPFAVLSFIFMLITPNVQERANDGTRLDVPGSVLTALVLFPFSLALSWGGANYAWASPVIIGLFAAAVVFLVALIIVERKTSDPIFPGKLFADRSFMLMFLTAFCFSAICSANLFLPTVMQQGLGFSATESSLPMAAVSIVCILATSIVGMRFAKSQKAKGLVLIESVIAVAVGIALLIVAPGTGLVLVCIIFGVLGISQAVHQVVSYSYPAVAMKPTDIAVATAFMMFGQIVATTVFNAILGALMNIDIFMPLRAVIVFAVVMIVCTALFKDAKTAQ